MIDVRLGAERPTTRLPWLESRHSFSFGHHRDAANTHHGLLLVSNDDVVRAGTGFDTHPHRDMEIVTWVLDGRLEHKDSAGNRGELYPGLAQRMSAGRGIWHSEMNASRGDDVHFVQMWVPPDTEAVDPSYEQLDINAELARGGLVPTPAAGATTPPSPSASVVRCCGEGGWCRASRCPYPTPTTFMSTWLAAPPISRGPGGCGPVMPLA